MDKETLSKYGWVVIVIIILVILMGFASSFGLFTANSFEATWNSLSVSKPFRDHLGIYPEEKLEDIIEQCEYFYDALHLAVADISNGEIGANATASKENAVAGVYTDKNGVPVAALLKDSIEDVKTAPYVDMIIKLAGNTLSVNGGVAIDVYGGNVTIDGRVKGSSIVMDYDTNVGRCIQTRIAESLTVLGGEYIITSVCSDNGVGIFTACDTYIDGVSIKVSSDGSNVIRGIWAPNNKNIEITNSNISVTGNVSRAYGITLISPNGKISNCDVYAASPYLPNDDNSDYASMSKGISLSNGKTVIENCNIVGSLTAVSSTDNTLIVNGGTYKGYGHGGFYLVGGSTTPAYIYDATLVSLDENPGGYETLESMTNDAGIYVGGSNTLSNPNSFQFIMYMDNCKILNARQAIVIRGTSGESGHKVYVSNININDGSYVRIDNDTHKLFVGENCNFDNDDYRNKSATVLTPEQRAQRVEFTNENYKINP